MPQLLALEWNNRDVHMALASGRERRVVIEHAFSFAWNAEGATLEKPEQRIAEQIVKELDARGIGRPEVLVAVGRTSIELRQIQLPPAPDADLPDMVHFQAVREFNEFDERWRLDFVPIDQAADGSRTVLATAIAPAMIQQIEGVCQLAGLKMRRLLLRPCEAASLLSGDKSAAPEQLRLLVDLLAEEADLTAILDGKAVFLRTTRFGSDPPPLPALLAEIRLTMAAVQNQLGGRKVESLVLCGRDDVHANLARRIGAELGMQVELFDPFGAVALGPALKDSLPDNPGRFAPLLGMLLAEIRQTGHAIDFLHPRRPAPPPSRRKQLILAGAAVAVLGLSYLIYARIDYLRLWVKVNALKRESAALQIEIDRTKKTRDIAKEVAKWADAEVVWLDQLYELSKIYPSAEEAIVNELNVPPGVSQMILRGSAASDQIVVKLEENVRAKGGQISPPVLKEDRSSRQYPWNFDTRVRLKTEAKPEGKTAGKKEEGKTADKTQRKTEAGKTADKTQPKTEGKP